MAESPMPFDEADDYVFGRLTPAANHRFEEELARNQPLRRYVRELEEGALALAMCSPQINPPPEAWANIQTAVTRERHHQFLFPVFLLRWLWRGWPIAGGLTVGLLIHVALVHVNPPDSSAIAPGLVEHPAEQIRTVARLENKRVPVPEDSKGRKTVAMASNGGGDSPVSGKADVSAPIESAGRHGGNTFAAPKASDGGCRQSPRIRRAVLQAMAYQMGLTNVPDTQTLASAGGEAALKVDFVELSNPIMSVDSPIAMDSPPVSADAPNSPATGAQDPAFSPHEPISMFSVDNDLFIAVDPATLPVGVYLTIWEEDADGNQIMVGTVRMNGNPMVIHIANANLGEGFRYKVTANTTVLGFFPQ